MRIDEIIDGFVGLFYPNLCVCCSTNLVRGETYVCSHCLYGLDRTDFFRNTDNLVSQRFWGRTNIEYAAANYYYRKGNMVQKLIHQLKYNDLHHVGLLLGEKMGKNLKNSYFGEIDLIVPVPLHKKKLRKRGYNQSEWIAKGIAQIIEKQIDTQTLLRNLNSQSQTRKKKYKRWENVNTSFELANFETFADKHILLIDDVITTGATIEACAEKILSCQGTRVSVAALAIASD